MDLWGIYYATIDVYPGVWKCFLPIMPYQWDILLFMSLYAYRGGGMFGGRALEEVRCGEANNLRGRIKLVRMDYHEVCSDRASLLSHH